MGAFGGLVDYPGSPRVPADMMPRRVPVPLSIAALLFAGAPLLAAAQPATEEPRAPLTAPKPKPRLLPDRALTEAVRRELHLKPDEELTAEGLRNLYFLRAKDAGITRLDGLEKAVNLALIDLGGNAVSNLGPLAPLATLQSLDLTGNEVAALDPLAGLTGLQYLKADGNRVTDLRPLGGLERLSALYLSGNRVTDLGPLEGLEKLTSLDLAGNDVTDVGPLADLAWLSTVTLSDNRITDVGPLAGLSDLRFLILTGNAIEDLSPLAAAAEKDAAGPRRFAPYLRLYLAGNPLSDAAAGQVERLKAAGVRVILNDPTDAADGGAGDE